MATTVIGYAKKHGYNVYIAATVIIDADADLNTELFLDKACLDYGLDYADKATFAEDQKELIGLEVVYQMLDMIITQYGVRGAVQRINLGSDGTPDVSFYDRLKMFAELRNNIIRGLVTMEVKLGYVPHLRPSAHTPEFIGEKVSTFTDSDAEYSTRVVFGES